MKTTYLLLIVMLFVQVVYSQDISGGSDWKTEDEFRSVESQVIENIKWLESHPGLDGDKKVQSVYAYVMKWAMGCPYITVNIDAHFIKDLMNSDYTYSSQMTGAYTLGKLLYAVENEINDEPGACKRGIIGMIKTYDSIVKTKGDEAKNDIMEKYKQLLADNELDEFIKKTLDKNK